MTIDKSEFSSISQRVIYGILFHFSELNETEHNGIDYKKKKKLHDILQRLLQNLYNDPSLLDLPESQDETYPMYVCLNERPELYAIYKQVYKTLYSFYKFFYGTTLYGSLADNTIRLNRSNMLDHKISYKPYFLKTLASVGIDVIKDKEGLTIIFADHDDAAEIRHLALLCNDKSRHSHDGCYEFGEGMFDFALCNYNADYSYIPKRLDERYGNTLISELFEKSLEKGYTYAISKYFSNSGFWYDIYLRRGIGGFKISFSTRIQSLFVFGTMNGRGEKAMLEQMDKLSPKMQEYFLSICRKCTYCRGCIKGAIKEPFTVTVVQKGVKTDLCPLFPRHDWEQLDNNLIDLLYEYHELQETINS